MVLLQGLENSPRAFAAVDDVAAGHLPHAQEVRVDQRVAHRLGDYADRVAELGEDEVAGLPETEMAGQENAATACRQGLLEMFFPADNEIARDVGGFFFKSRRSISTNPVPR